MRLLELAALSAALLYLAFILAEKRVLARARKSLRLVVHVNGTRGKSETTRLLAAALRAEGRRVLAKTTGTEPRLILPDGREKRLLRAGSANVREQRNLILRAARLRADAVVAECMAVSPEAQRASTAFLSPDLLIVTNARPDHRETLGSPEEAAAVFAEGIPPGGLVVTADESLFPLLAEAAAARGARAILAEPAEGAGSLFPENAGAALAGALLAGAGREQALEGMRLHPPDPGAFGLRRLALSGGGHLLVADALAANDPASAGRLLERCGVPPTTAAAGLGCPRRVLLIANRADRPDRSLAFAEFAAERLGSFDAVFVAGPLPLRARRLLKAASRDAAQGAPSLRRFGSGKAALAALRGESEACFVFATGNWKGLGPALAAAAPLVKEAT